MLYRGPFFTGEKNRKKSRKVKILDAFIVGSRVVKISWNLSAFIEERNSRWADSGWGSINKMRGVYILFGLLIMLKNVVYLNFFG